MRKYSGEVNGYSFSLKSVTPKRLKQLDEVSKAVVEWKEENDQEVWLYDEEFRSDTMKQIADIILDWDEKAMPSEMYASDELEFSEILDARTIFFAKAGIM